jgi:gas vesicle protein
MGSFLAGLGIGFGIGVLLAPMSGTELRDSISDRGGELADNAREKYNRVRNAAGNAVESFRSEAQQRTGTEA